MSRHSDPFDAPQFVAHWRLLELPEEAHVYGQRLSEACQREAAPNPVTVTVDEFLFDVVVVHHDIHAEELAAAIDRSQTFLFSLIRRAGLYQPRSLWLIAAHRSR